MASSTASVAAPAQSSTTVVTNDSNSNSNNSSNSVGGAVPSARNNNLVAESDLRVAVAAIHDYFEQRPQPPHAKNEPTEHSRDPIKQQHQLYHDCARSLTNKLKQLVQPVSDEAFHAYLARYRDDWMASAEELLQQQQLSQQQTTGVIVPDDDNDELLLDHSALARVQELRQQVRDQAADIVTLRTATLDRSVALAERQWQWLWHKNDTTTTTTKNDTASSLSNKNNTFVVPEHYQTEVQQMKEAVESMHAVLQETGTKLPPKLRRFHTTLHEIEQALQLQQSQPMSQIEKAIYHREHIMYTDSCENEDDDIAGAGEPMEQLLANLLCRD